MVKKNEDRPLLSPTVYKLPVSVKKKQKTKKQIENNNNTYLNFNITLTKWIASWLAEKTVEWLSSQEVDKIQLHLINANSSKYLLQ